MYRSGNSRAVLDGPYFWWTPSPLVQRGIDLPSANCASAVSWYISTVLLHSGQYSRMTLVNVGIAAR